MDKDRKSAVDLSIQEHFSGRFGGIIMVKNDESQPNITSGAVSIHAAENGGGIVIFDNSGKTVGMFGVSNAGDVLLTGDRYGNETGCML